MSAYCWPSRHYDYPGLALQFAPLMFDAIHYTYYWVPCALTLALAPTPTPTLTLTLTPNLYPNPNPNPNPNPDPNPNPNPNPNPHPNQVPCAKAFPEMARLVAQLALQHALGRPVQVRRRDGCHEGSLG